MIYIKKDVEELTFLIIEKCIPLFFKGADNFLPPFELDSAHDEKVFAAPKSRIFP